MIVNVKKIVDDAFAKVQGDRHVQWYSQDMAEIQHLIESNLRRELASQDARLSDIPEHAVGKFETYTVIPANGPYAEATIESRPDGQGIYAYVRLANGNYMDLTEQYTDWLAKQPKTNRVTFEWPAEKGKN